jgi:hypothetical protein
MSSSAGISSFSQVSAHSMGFCSTSSTSSPFEGPTHIGRDGFLQSALRAGGPYLCALPANTIQPGPGYDNEATVRQIQQCATDVLHGLQLQFGSIRIVGRVSRVEHEPEQVTTVLIGMPNNSQPELWCRASREIYQQLQRHRHLELSVELIETDLFNGIYCSPVERSHSITRKWENIAQDIIARCDNRDWTGLDCFRYGTNPQRGSNPVTVIIRVHRGCEEPFTTAARFVHGILVMHGEANVDVIFMKDASKVLCHEPNTSS